MKRKNIWAFAVFNLGLEAFSILLRRPFFVCNADVWLELFIIGNNLTHGCRRFPDAPVFEVDLLVLVTTDKRAARKESDKNHK